MRRFMYRMYAIAAWLPLLMLDVGLALCGLNYCCQRRQSKSALRDIWNTAPAPSGDDERMHCSLCGTPIYEDIISGNPDAPLIPLDENGECPECAAAPAPSGDQEQPR